MKNIFYIASALLGVLVSASACNNDTPTAETKILEIESAKVSFGWDVSTGEIIAATESDVTATLDESGTSWCEVSQSGNTVTVTVEQNSGKQSRHTFVTISADGRSRDVAISQAMFTLSVDGALEFNCLDSDSVFADSRAISYSPANLTDISGSEECEWIRSVNVDTTTGTATVIADGNDTATARSAEVTLTYGVDRKETVTVTQGVFDLFVEASSLTFGRDGGSETVAFDRPGTSTINVTSNVAWISVSKNETEKTISISTQATSESRVGRVTVECNGITKDISVTQSRLQ
ncbi:MAG: hypothetical protein LBV18_03335 [Alistipes sp.]|jgi:hypothetical protein|nr:hypothetical protein [Alistipes sp.]